MSGLFFYIQENPHIRIKQFGDTIDIYEEADAIEMKDVFKGNLKDPKGAIIDLILFAAVMFICAIIFLITALFYNNCEPSARVLLFILALVSFFLAIFCPAGAIYFISRMTRYPRISRAFFKDDAYVVRKSKKKGI